MLQATLICENKGKWLFGSDKCVTATVGILKRSDSLPVSIKYRDFFRCVNVSHFRAHVWDMHNISEYGKIYFKYIGPPEWALVTWPGGHTLGNLCTTCFKAQTFFVPNDRLWENQSLTISCFKLSIRMKPVLNTIYTFFYTFYFNNGMWHITCAKASFYRLVT